MVIVAGFQLDAALTEEHVFDSEVTSYPVETGTDVTDHVRISPITVTIDGVVSDTPIGLIRDARSGTTLPSDDALAHLLGIRDAREPIRVETDLKVYDSMVMTSLSIPKNSKVGDALKFKAVFTEIRLITNERTIITTSSPRGQKKVKIGNLVLVQLGSQVAEANQGTIRAVSGLVNFFR